jgi:hypothetical protein
LRRERRNGLKPSSLHVVSISVILVILTWAWSSPAAVGESRSRFHYLTTCTFENRGDDSIYLTSDDVSIVFFPDNSWQTIRILNASHALALEYVDVDGNRLAVLDQSFELPPRSNFSFTVVYQIDSSDRSIPEIDPMGAEPISRIPPELVGEFCFESETFPVGNEEIRALAYRLAANETSVLGMVNRLLDWFVENVSYGTLEVPRYANETLLSGFGDCDDQAMLLVTMCRALGIPSLLQVGPVFHEGIDDEWSYWDGHLKVKQQGVGWHGWALVFIPPWGWLPIEMTMPAYNDAIERITGAPEFITCLNISRQEYVGDSRRTRERVMGSDLFVTVTDVLVEEKASTGMEFTTYIVLGVIVGALVVLTIIVLKLYKVKKTGEKII